MCVRSPGRLGGIPVDHPNLAKVSADARDQAALADALEGVDAVVQALGVPAGQDMMLKPVCLFSDATRVLIAAMEEAGVKRLIAVTGFGAGDSRDRGGCLYNTAFHLFLGARRTTTRTCRRISSRTADWTG